MSIVKINNTSKIEGAFKVISSPNSPTDNTPTYALYRTPSITDEGTEVIYTLDTTNLAEGTLVSYTVTGISQEDLSSGSLTGDFVITTVGTASVSFTIANDLLTEGTETMTLSAGGRSLDVTINDTSLNPFNTSILLNGNGTNSSANKMIANSSGYNYPFVRSGTPTLCFDDLDNSPSVYFDGSGDYYSIPSEHTVPFHFDSRTFTVEAWVKFDTVANNSSNTARYVVTNYNSATTGWGIGIFNGKLVALLTGDAANIIGTTTVLPNVWYHVAVCGSTGSYKLFLNGVQEGNTYTGATRLDGGAVGIGALVGRSGYVGTAPFKGYVRGIRVIDGSNLYTQNFSDNIPTTPFENVTNTILLINPSPNIIDSTSKNKLILSEGDCEVTTSNFKYGTGSLYFNSTNSSGLKIAANSDLAFGTGDFTIEFWCNFTDYGYYNNGYSGINACRTIISQGGGNATSLWTHKFRILIDANNSTNAAGGIAFYQYTTTGCKTVVAVNNAQWHHIAFTRSSGILRCFVDGVLKSTVNNTADFNDTTTPYTIGRQGDYVNYNFGQYKGYLDDFRMIKGTALYTQNFTPPTQGLVA